MRGVSSRAMVMPFASAVGFSISTSMPAQAVQHERLSAEPHERLMALAVRPDHATLIVPALEHENATRSAEQVEIVGWRDGEDPYALVRAAPMPRMVCQ